MALRHHRSTALLSLKPIAHKAEAPWGKQVIYSTLFAVDQYSSRKRIHEKENEKQKK